MKFLKIWLLLVVTLPILVVAFIAIVFWPVFVFNGPFPFVLWFLLLLSTGLVASIYHDQK